MAIAAGVLLVGGLVIVARRVHSVRSGEDPEWLRDATVPELRRTEVTR